MPYGMHETWSKVVSDKRHSIVEKIGKEIRHNNIVKWQEKVAKMHLIEYQNSKASKRLITLTFWHFSKGFMFSPNVRVMRNTSQRLWHFIKPILH